jgi:hypothetical protein
MPMQHVSMPQCLTIESNYLLQLPSAIMFSLHVPMFDILK